MTEGDRLAPVIALDGGAGTGKGTVRSRLAALLDFFSLDSGVLYRALGVVCSRKGLTVLPDMIAAAHSLNLRMDGEQVILDGHNETRIVRSDEGGKLASTISAIPEIRGALLEFQLKMRRQPGLVADGRDQCYIFDTPFRYFFVCNAEVRAERRVRQFRKAGLPANYQLIFDEIRRRDDADQTRLVQPLRPHPEALIIDNSTLSINEVV